MALNPLSKILEENKLTGPNFTDWLRNLRIVLNLEKIGYVLDQDPPLIGIIPDDADVDQLDVHNAEVAAFDKWKDDDLRAKSYVLASMTNELQRQHEKMPDAKSMVNHLQELYGEHSRIARYEVTKALFRAKLQEGGNVGDHVLNMIGLLERLEELNIFLDTKLEVELNLQPLLDSFGPFIMNFHMNKLHCSKSDLHNMLCTAHATMKGMNTDTVLLASSKSKKKRKNKKVSEMKPTGGVTKTKGKVASKGKRFHCNKEGHWKRNCTEYLKSLKVKDNDKPSEGMLIKETSF